MFTRITNRSPKNGNKILTFRLCLYAREILIGILMHEIPCILKYIHTNYALYIKKYSIALLFKMGLALVLLSISSLTNIHSKLVAELVLRRAFVSN